MSRLKPARRLLQVLSFICVSQLAFARGVAINGEYIVKFKPQTGSVRPVSGKAGFASMAQANKLAADKGRRVVSALKGVAVQKNLDSAAALHLSGVDSSSLQTLKSNPDVEYIEPNYIFSLDPTNYDNANMTSLGVSAGVSDTYGQSYAPTKVTESWVLEKAPAAASKTVVAVIDTGLDIRHAVFADSNGVWGNAAEINGATGIDDDGNGYVDDKNGWNFVDSSPNMIDDAGHGTHVAGIVLGTGQDILQVPVRESKVVIMPLKFLNSNGSGTTADAIDAIYYAVNNGAKVINNSWGGPSYSRALHDAYKFAYDHDVVLVTAAGNSNVNLDSTPIYPAAYDTPSNISVGASTASDRRASFSNYSSSLVHIFAPGTNIFSTIPGNHCSDANNLYNYCMSTSNGTSMAAPFVAGLAALAMRESPQLSAYQIRGVILSATDSSAYLNGYSQNGGRLNALKAIQIAQAQVAATTWAPSYSPVYKIEASSESAGGGSGGAGGCGLVKALVDETQQGPPSGGQMAYAVVVGLLMLMPLVMALKLRRSSKNYVRQYERFTVAKDVVIQIGDQVVNVASQTLAVGGLSFKSDQPVFEKGQKIKLKINDVPEEIEGEIVWSSSLNSFGVKFTHVTESLKAQVQGLTAGLMPT